MSQIIAAVSWHGGPGISPAQVAEALRGWPADLRRVDSVPRAVFGRATLSVDRWRNADDGALVDAESGLVLAADCRLDNRDALRSQLGANAQSTDSTLLRLAYERWGAEMGSYLLGDFSCVIWDERKQQLLAIRDPLGIKPLVYTTTPDAIVVASDVEALVQLTRPSIEPDDLRVVEHLLWDYESTDRTYWKAISRLPGGHALTASAKEKRVRRYWRPPSAPNSGLTQSAVYEEFRHRFVTSVERRIESDWPIVAHLSGGVDSSLIVCVADGIQRGRSDGIPALHAVSERYPGMACDEGPYIAAVASQIAFPTSGWEAFPIAFPDLDAPSIAGPSIRAHRTSGSQGDLEIAGRLGARVVLGGLGGDQLGSTMGLSDDRVMARLGSFLLESFRRRDLTFRQRTTRVRYGLRLLSPIGLRRTRAVWAYRRKIPAWLSPRCHDLAASLAKGPYEQDVELETHVQRAHWKDLTSGRVATGLDIEQRCAAVAGVEARFPFLDRELVDFVLSIPPASWPAPGGYVRLHREAMGDLLPVEVRHRTGKVGFSDAMARRIREGSGRLRAIVEGTNWCAERWVDQTAARALCDRVLRNDLATPGEGHALWRICSLEAWLRRVFAYPS